MPSDLDPAQERAYPVYYDSVKRKHSLEKKQGWPIHGHSLNDVRRHLSDAFWGVPGISLVMEQVDVYVGACQHNLNNLGPEMKRGAAAFLALWEISKRNAKDTCKICKKYLR